MIRQLESGEVRGITKVCWNRKTHLVQFYRNEEEVMLWPGPVYVNQQTLYVIRMILQGSTGPLTEVKSDGKSICFVTESSVKQTAFPRPRHRESLFVK